MSRPVTLRNINVMIISDNDTHVLSANACAGEIVPGNPFRIATGLDVKAFLADNIVRHAVIDYVSVPVQEKTVKVRNLGHKLLSNENSLDPEPEPSRAPRKSLPYRL